MQPALLINGLTKRFGPKLAVDQLTLEVPAGSMYGLVGPNGAGKTTTLSMTTGLLRPDAGSATVLGHDVWADPPAAKSAMGVLPDGLRLFDRLTGRELITYSGRLRGVPEADLEQRREGLLANLGLVDDADKLVVDYSAGMTKKIGLACALVHAPRLVILDEPFEAVDPVSGEGIRTILRSYVANGGTVIFSSHVMELVENLCDHVAVIGAGTLLAAGTLDEVRAGENLQQRFLQLVGPSGTSADMSWLTGASGDAGLTGASGDAGLTGASGDAGLTGASGDAGRAGAMPTGGTPHP